MKESVRKTHIPVLVNEVLIGLKVHHGCLVVDATFGAGGHTTAFLQQGATVIALDRDPAAIEAGQRRFAADIAHGRLTLFRSRFDRLADVVGERRVHGVLFDLGMSSAQIVSGRGFSFSDETLDMRMDPELGVSAADLVDGLSERELTGLFTRLGEEPFAKKIARGIVKHRNVQPIRSARALSTLIEKIVGRRGRIHPATRVFQALRMAVNDERGQLSSGLIQAEGVLLPGGRIAVLSYHSGEDRIVKNFGRDGGDKGRLHVITKKPMGPDEEERKRNPSSRSAKLRLFEKTHFGEKYS